MKITKIILNLIAAGIVFSTPLHGETLQLQYSTYLGGENTSNDKCFALALDSQGRAYLTGDVASSDFPTENPYQPGYGGGMSDIMITSFDSSGSSLVYSTYLGGSDDDAGRGIALDSLNRAYLTGYSLSADFPTENPYQAASGGNYDAVAVCLSSSGSALVYSTYLGGADEEYGHDIRLDSQGRAYLTGYTASIDFPTEDPYQPGFGAGNYDAFVCSLTSSGSSLNYSTYLGGEASDNGWSIALDSSGRACLAGETSSEDFPTANPYQASLNSSWDITVTRFSSSGSTIIYSTYLGGSDIDGTRGICLDSAGRAYLAGYTASSDFPTQNSYQAGHGGGAFDSIALCLSSSGSSLIYSTFLGGSGYERGYGIALDSADRACLTGRTESPDYPTLNPYQASLAGTDPDVFLSSLSSSGSALVYSSYLGGSGEDYGRSISLDSAGGAWLAGYTWSTDFPTENPYQPGNKGLANAFLSKLALLPSTTPTTAPTATVTPTPEGYQTPSASPTSPAGGTPPPSASPAPSVTPSPLSPALELVKTVDGLPDGAVGIIRSCSDPSYYYAITNTGDTYISALEVWDDNGTPGDPGDDIQIGALPGPLAPDETVGLEYSFERRAVRLNTATVTGNPTDSLGNDLPGLPDVSETDYALDFDWLVMDGNDYNGDGLSDTAAWKCGAGKWYIQICPYCLCDSSVFYYGRDGDIPSSGDFDGDGTTEVAVFRDDSGLWAIRAVTSIYFGTDGDIPVPADYDGDGSTDPAVFRRSIGLWAIRSYTRVYYGGQRDLPIPGYYDGGLQARVGVFRPEASLWAIRGLTRCYYGAAGDYPVPADYDGDGIREPGVFRGETGLWALAGVTRTYFGERLDYPQPADYDGGGYQEIAVYRPSTGLWAVQGSTRYYWGGGDYIPLTR